MMELLPTKALNLTTMCQPRHANGYLVDFSIPRRMISWGRFSRGIRFPHINLQSKKSAYQDFQDFAKPSRLLPVTAAKFCSGMQLEEILSLSNFEMSTLYIVQLSTSNEFGSSLMDSDAAIFLSLIDANENSVLQRISSALVEDLSGGNELSNFQERRFQGGSVDTITFQGPEMGEVNAIWIGLESGSWRPSYIRLIVVDSTRSYGLDNVSNDVQYQCLSYDFEVDGVLLGEGGVSMSELRPKSVTNLPMDSSSTLFATQFPTSKSEQKTLNEKSMKEYMNLKLSSLIYDAIIVSAGSAAFNASSNERTASAFLFGGLCGFVYLLLLQKAVDGLSASTLTPGEEGSKGIMQVLGGFKGPLSKLALILAVSSAALKYGLEGNIVEATPIELLVGLVGFLTCRIAVLFAAFKPLETEKEDM